MDGGPFRAVRPAGRQVAAIGRSEASQSHVDEPKQVSTHKPASTTSARPHAQASEKSAMRFVWPIIAIIVAAMIGLGGWFAGSTLSSAQGAAPVVDTTKYQAVFFTNGQVYFGKLQAGAGDYLKLTDIYYLQNNQSNDASNPQKAGNDQNSVQLIKLGNEIHGPEDEMMIAKDQVLFYENLKPNSKVAESIKKYKETNK